MKKNTIEKNMPESKKIKTQTMLYMQNKNIKLAYFLALSIFLFPSASFVTL